MAIVKTKSFQLGVNSKGDPNSKRLAIALPGRLDTKDYECFNKHLEYLANKGFYAVSFDPPGTWESPGGIELFSTTNYIKAVNELIEYYGNKPTLLLGHSRGGATSTLAGTSNQHVIGLVLINPSLGSPTPPSPEMREAGVYIDHRDLPPGTKRTEQKREFRASLNYFEDGAKYNDAETLRTCTKPKIIFYATEDEFNSPEEVETLFSSVPEPKELYKIECTHDYRLYPKVVEEINEVMGSFIDKHLPN
ncbi:alpha/beta hydrolase [Patescibacteria group bacterium]|nr:alpha/beta hydrolase [Patescibacteria group bacterium]